MDEQPLGSSYLLNGELQAALEVAPDIDTGYQWMLESYEQKKWDNPTAAKEALAKYGEDLRYKFEQNGAYDPSTILNLTTPLSEVEATGEDEDEKKLNRLTAWEKANIEEIDKSDDPLTILDSGRLKRSVAQYAGEQRRDVNTKDQGMLEAGYHRAKLGMLEGIYELVGAEESLKELRENVANTSPNDSFMTKLGHGAASAAGTLVGTVGAGAVGALAGPVGAAAAVGGYLIGTGVGSAKDVYERSLEATGDPGRAKKAGAIEIGAQALTFGPLGKLYGKVGRGITSTIFGKAAQEAVSRPLRSTVARTGLSAGSFAAGSAGSRGALAYGTKDESIDPFNSTDIAVDLVLGTALVGAGKGMEKGVESVQRFRERSQVLNGKQPVIDEAVPKQNVTVVGGVIDNDATAALADIGVVKDVEPDKQLVSDTNGVETGENRVDIPPDSPTGVSKAKQEAESSGPLTDFITSDGSRYTLAENGTTRVKPSTGEVFLPFDKTFFVEPETAAKIGGLIDQVDPEGNPVLIYTDGERLIVKSPYVDENLQLTEHPTGFGSQTVNVKTEAGSGLHPVEANIPKDNGDKVVHQIHVGHEIKELPREGINLTRSLSAEAAGLEPTFARRLREETGSLEPEIQGLFGSPDSPGMKYIPAPNIETLSAAERQVQSNPSGTLNYLLTSDNTRWRKEEAVASFLMLRQMNEGFRSARDAGDTASASQFSAMADLLGRRLSEAGVEGGQFVQAYSIWGQTDPDMHVFGIEQKLREQAANEVAQNLKISPQELKNTDVELKDVGEQLKIAEEQATKPPPEPVTELDKPLAETESVLAELEKAAEERLSKYNEQLTEENKAAQADIDTIEKGIEERTVKATEELEGQLEAAQARIKELESQAEKKVESEKSIRSKITEKADELERRGKERATKEVDKEIADAESALNKVKSNKEKGAKVKQEVIDRAEENLKKLRIKKENISAEDGLNPEERKLFRKLKTQKEAIEKEPAPTKESVLSEKEKKEIDELQSALKDRQKLINQRRAKVGPKEGEKKKLDSLRKTLDSNKKLLSETKLEDVLPKKEANQLSQLRKKRKGLIQRRKDIVDREKGKTPLISPELSKRIASLKEKQANLTKRKYDYEKAVEKKLAKLPPEDADRIRELMRTGKRVDGTNQLKAYMAALAIEKKALGDSSKWSWRSFWTANQLMSLGPSITSFVSNMTAIPVSIGSYMGADFLRTIKYATEGKLIPDFYTTQYVRGLGLGARRGWRGFQTELKGIKVQKDSYDGLGEQGQYKAWRNAPPPDFIKTAPDWMKKLKLNQFGWSFRMLGAIDALSSGLVEEGHARVEATRQVRAEGLTGDAARARISDMLYGTADDAKNALIQAENEAAILKAAGFDTPKSQIYQRMHEILYNQRPESFRMTTRNLTAKDVIMGKPDGTWGAATDLIKRMIEAEMRLPFTQIKGRPLPYIITPFLNTMMGWLRANLNNTAPYTIGKAIDLARTEGTKSLEFRNMAGRALTGTVFTAGVMAYLSANRDNPDAWFDVTGKGPDDPDDLRTLKNSGWKPWSIKLGGHYFPLAYTPVALPFALIASYENRAKYDKKFDQKAGAENVAMGMLSMVDLISQQTFIQSVGQLIDGFKYAKTGLDVWENLANFTIIRPVKGFTPFSGGLARSIAKLTDDDIDVRQGIWSRFIQGVPLLQRYGTLPALNGFGEPVAGTMAERAQQLLRFWHTESYDPDWQWLANNNYSLNYPDIEPIVGGGVERTGKGKERAEVLGAKFANVLTREEGHELLKTVGPQVRQIVSRYRNRYGNSARQDRIQKQMDTEIAQAYALGKRRLFFQSDPE